jgi:hypothetical protein
MEIRPLRETDDRLGFHYSKYGFIAADPIEGQADTRPEPLMMFLSFRKIEDGIGE